MPIKFIGGTCFRGEVGQPLAEPLVVQVRGPDGKEVAGKVVTFTCHPPGSLTLGTERQATDTTKADGTARVEVKSVRTFGPNTIRAIVATANGKTEEAEATVEGFHPQVEVRDMNGRIVAIRRQQPVPPREVPWWPIAIMVVTALVVGGLLAWGLLRPTTAEPTVVTVTPPPPTPTPTTAHDPAAWSAIGNLAQDVGTFKADTEDALAHKPDRHEVEADARERFRHLHGETYGTLNGLARLARVSKRNDGMYAEVCRNHPDLPGCIH